MPSLDPDRIDLAAGSVLRRARTDKHMTMRDLADSLSVNVATIWRYENGESSMTLETVSRVAKILEIPATEFLSS